MPRGRVLSTDGVECVRALSWEQAGEIRERFALLNPYDQTLVSGSVEKENLDPESGRRRQLWCYAISAKRYALYNLDESGEPILRKWSEHGLGHLLNPTDPDGEDRDWIRTCWEMFVRRAHGLPVEEPTWLERPALSRITASSPHMLRPFARHNAGRRTRSR